MDARLQRCSCGYSFIPSTFMKMRMLWSGSVVKTCPRCGARMTFKLMNHTVKIGTVEIKNKGEVWKNG